MKQMLGLTFCIVYKRISMLLLIIPFVHFSFSADKSSVKKILIFYESQNLQSFIHIEIGQVNCWTDNKTAELYVTFYFLFPSLTPM